MSNTLKEENFCKKLLNISEPYKNKEFEIIEFLNQRVIIENKYGRCNVKKAELLKGHLPTKRSAVDKTSYTIQQFKETHGDVYDYSKFIYVDKKHKGIIICKLHGEFTLTANTHISMKTGCSKCSDIRSAQKRLKTKEQFIEDAKVVHGDLFDYSLVDYTGAHNLVKILCKFHGVFEQKPNAHLSDKNGCGKCWKNFKDRYLNSRGDKGILYLCRFFNSSEEFLKIGVTSTTIERRYRGKEYSFYDYEVLKFLESKDKLLIWDLENELKVKFKSFRITPRETFMGYTECFNIKQLNKIYEEFETIGENRIT